MKKIILIALFFVVLFLAGCNSGSKSSWQAAYYEGSTDADIIYGPIFTNYEGCKDWAIRKEPDAYNNYVFCAKNCHDSIDGTPICEEAVRSWAPFERSMTFDNYKE